MFLTLIGQNMEGLSGGGGWLGAGLLGLVLSWLMLRHLPEKDRIQLDTLKQFREELALERTKSESIIAVVVGAFTKESEECRAERLSLGASMTVERQALGNAMSVEREKDRQSRAILWQQVKEVISSRGMPVAEEYTPPEGMPTEKKT